MLVQSLLARESSVTHLAVVSDSMSGRVALVLVQSLLAHESHGAHLAVVHGAIVQQVVEAILPSLVSYLILGYRLLVRERNSHTLISKIDCGNFSITNAVSFVFSVIVSQS